MAESKRILYRGVPMIEGWPEKIEAAQRAPSYTLNEQTIARIRYGTQHKGTGKQAVACVLP